MCRARLDLKYRIKQIIKDKNNIKLYLRYIRSWGLKERWRDNSGYWNSKYNIPFKRTQHGMIYDGCSAFEERDGRRYIAKEIL